MRLLSKLISLGPRFVYPFSSFITELNMENEIKPFDPIDYYNDHLPYSIGIFLKHKNLTAGRYRGDVDILNAVFVGSIVKGRMLLDMLGIALNQAKPPQLYRKEPKGDDVCATHLANGTMVVIDDLSDEDKNALKHFLIAVNKYEAHLTKQEVPRDLDQIKPAYQVILRLVRDHVYKPNNVPFKWEHELN